MANFLPQQIKKGLTLVLFLALSSLSIKAQIVNETFNYNVGDTLLNVGYSNTAASTNNTIKVTGPALTYNLYPTSGVGNSITIDSAGLDVYKSYSTGTATDIYTAFIVKVTKAATGDYFFATSPNPFATTYTTRLFVKTNATNDIAFGILKGSSTANIVYTGFTYALNTNYLMVIHYKTLPGATNDSIHLYINPAIASSLPGVPTVTCTDVISADLSAHGSYVFRQGASSSGARVDLSCLRIDTTVTGLFDIASTPTAAQPSFSPIGGTYNNAQTVSMSSTTAGASIYYTLDGSTPTSASTLYANPITVDSAKTLKARAYKTGYDSSIVSNASYIFVAANPTFNPTPGTFVGNQNITLNCSTVGASIYYTTNGTTPTMSSSLYTAPIAITTSTNFKIKAFKSGYDTSITVSGNFIINAQPTAAAPVFAPSGGVYNASQSVTITSATAGADIRYTLDNSEPTSASTLYTAALTVNSSDTIKARTFKTGYDSSAVTTEIYRFKAATPAISPAGGTFTSPQSISISCASAGAQIYYTLNGIDPTSSSTLYTAPFIVSTSNMVKARAYVAGYDTSSIDVQTYIINTPVAATPTFSPGGGSYTSAQNVTISSTTVGASIRYTLDGSEPTSTSLLYSTPISISTITTLKARAFANGFDSSAVGVASYYFSSSNILTSVSDVYFQNFDSLGTNYSIFPTSWTGFRYGGSGSLGAVLTPIYFNGTATSGAIYAAGPSNTGDRALGSIASGTTVPIYGTYFVNQTGSTITKVILSGVNEQWKSGSDPAVNEVDTFSYSFNSSGFFNGTWNFLPGMNLNEIATSTTTSAGMDGNLPANRMEISDSIQSINWNNGDTLWIRWLDPNNVGTDGLCAVDNFSLKVSDVVVVSTPTFTPASGTYTSAQNVTISTTTAGATIHYTTDGTSPTAASALYTSPINVNTSMIIKAKAFKTGFDSSAVAYGAYVINLAVAPTVVTNAVSQITSHGVILHGDVTSDGGATVLRRGFCYSTNQNPTIANDTIGQAGGVGAFSANLNTLIPNTTYYYKAYAVNSGGLSYGSQMSFQTLIDGIDLSEGKAISMYPNPAKNEVNINNADGFSVTVYSLVGQQLKKEEIKNPSYKLTISDLPSGVYILSFQNDGKKFAYRLTKQ